MKSGAITLKDMAKVLGLSVSTVSKALRNSYEISLDTKKIVTQYAAKNNYQPNPIAQGLRKGRSKLIGIVLTNIDNDFFSQVINGIESVAIEKDYTVIISQTHESWKSEVLTVQHLFSRSVDGLIVSLSAETSNIDHFTELHDRGLPIVFFDRVPDKLDTHKVISNNFKGAYEATQHLIQNGFKRIAHITSSNHLSITLERLEGYRKGLEDNNLPVNEAYIKYCVHGGMIREENEQALQELLSLENPPDAIFTASDRISITTLTLLRRMNMQIPEQIALVGFTNSASSEIFNPSLTSIVQPAFEMGKAATEMLIEIIESPRPVTDFEKRILNTKMIIRESSVRPVKKIIEELLQV
ncbi:MAG: LacI family transcriptional regulator [Bacteroidota bacterium]|nr:LacI family transcriptional regulator [Bacteroidota bacterium]